MYTYFRLKITKIKDLIRTLIDNCPKQKNTKNDLLVRFENDRDVMGEVLRKSFGATQENIDCKQGCSYCCHLRVSCYRIEAKAIAKHISTLPHWQKDIFFERIADYCKKTPTDKSKLLVLNLPCPFLINSKCSIYEIRPFTCRQYHSRDVRACEKSFQNPKLLHLQHPQSVYLLSIGNWVHREILARYNDFPTEVESLDLVEAVALEVGILRSPLR